MKSLSLSRPLVIVMVGVPGSGKSFFARQFSDMFNAPLVSTDRIRSELFQESTFSPDEERIVQRISGMFEEQLFRTQRSFIIDGGMNSRVARYELMKEARKHGFDTLVVWVQTDNPTSLTRSLRRNGKQYDEYNQTLTSEQYQKLVKTFTPPTQRDKVLVISGKHTFATQARMMLKRLAPARETHSSQDIARPAPIRPAVQQPQQPQQPPQPPQQPTTRRLTIQ